MTDQRKPFLSIAGDVDDDALEAIARAKGVPALRSDHEVSQSASTSMSDMGPRGQGRSTTDKHSGSPRLPEAPVPTPRQRMSYVKACLPDYALTELKTRAVRERVSVNHLLLKALVDLGIAIRPEDMVEDGRRLRGSKELS